MIQPSFVEWTAVLFECFVIIVLGYLSTRFKLISNHAKDLHAYLATFALPSIIFLNITKMDYDSVNWSFLICMLVAKLIVFMTVTIVTLVVSKPTNFGYAGALSILATQSNDFALGYPLVKSIYGKNNQDMLNYLNLQAPIQLLLFNPLGLAMLEYEKSRQKRKSRDEAERRSSIASRKSTKSDDNPSESKCHACNKFEVNKNQLERSSMIDHIDSSCDAAVITILDNDNNTQIRRLSVSSFNPSHINHDINMRRDCNNNNNNNTITATNIGIMKRYPRKRSNSVKGLDEHIKIKEIESKIERQLKLIRANLNTSDPIESRILTENSQSSIISGSFQNTDIVGSQSISWSSSANSQSMDLIPNNHLHHHQHQHNPCSCSDNALLTSPLPVSPQKQAKIDVSFLISLLTNPLILASVSGLLVNLIHGPTLPQYISKVSKTLAASFAAPALFVIGVSMFGKFKLLRRNQWDLLLSVALVFTKLVVLPNIMRFITMIVLPYYYPAEESSSLINFSYLYGSLPTAPTAVVIAQQYDILTNAVSIIMVLSIVCSAPLLLGTVLIINPASME